MRGVNRRSIGPLAAAVLLAVGSLMLIFLDEQESYSYEHLQRQLSTSTIKLTDIFLDEQQSHDHERILRQLSKSTEKLTEEHLAVWDNVDGSCKILFHIHVPKTAGSSIRAALMNTSSYVSNNHDDKKNVYTTRGINTMETIVPIMKTTFPKTPSTFITVSAEVGITDLVSVGYPFFNDTCFFSTAREPHEWLISAENHMRTAGKDYGFNGTYGYFDQANIQTSMLYYDHDRPIEEQPRTHPRTGSICVYTASRITEVLCAIDENLDSCSELGHLNRRNHSHDITAEVKDVVQEKYWKDAQYWNDLVANDGKVCH